MEPRNVCVERDRALHGAERPEEGFVVPRRRPRIAGAERARRRKDEMVRSASQEREQQRRFLERSSERLCEQSEVFEVTKISSKDQILQRSGSRFSRVSPRTVFNSVFV